MLRNIFFYIFFLPATAFYSAVAVLFRKIAPWSGRAWARVTVWLTGIDLDVDLSVVEPNKRYIFIANHQSQLDIPVVTHSLRARRVGFVAKDMLFKIPLFGPALTAAGHISIDRSNPRRAMKSIGKAAEEARQGANIVVFAEGTRQEQLDKLGEFKIGGMILALKTGIPVVPLIISGTGEALPKHTFFLRPRKVKVRALPPIEAGRYTLKQREQFKDDLYDMMNKAYQEQRNG